MTLLLLVCLLLVIIDFTKGNELSAFLFPFSIFAELLIISNVLLILTIWVMKKGKKYFVKTSDK